MTEERLDTAARLFSRMTKEGERRNAAADAGKEADVEVHKTLFSLQFFTRFKVRSPTESEGGEEMPGI